MKTLTKKNYIDETIRLCKNLVSFKYEAEYDICLKRLISKDVDCLHRDFRRKRSNFTEKQLLLDNFFDSVSEMVCKEYGTKEDTLAKKRCHECIVAMQEYEKRRAQEKAEKERKDFVAQLMSACVKRG